MIATTIDQKADNYLAWQACKREWFWRYMGNHTTREQIEATMETDNFKKAYAAWQRLHPEPAI